MADREFADDIIEELLEKLGAGKFLVEICRDPRMPSARTVQRWANGEDELAQRIAEARELGFWLESERLVEEMRTCGDAQKARNVLDATRWRLGKISQCFRDKPLVGVAVNVDAEGTFDAVARLLEGASASLSSGRESTYLVDEHGAARPIGAPGGLPDLAADGRQGLRQDQDGE